MSRPRRLPLQDKSLNQVMSGFLVGIVACAVLALCAANAKATTYACYIANAPHTLRSPGDVRTVSSPSDCVVGESVISWEVFPVGSTPVSVSYDGANIWVSNAGENTISKLRASDGANLGTFAAGYGPGKSITVGGDVWIVNWTANTLTKLRASDGALLATIPVRSAPAGLAFDGTNIWVSFYGSNSVSKLRPSDGVELSNTPGVNSPLDIVFDGANVWAANNTGGGAVTKIDAGTGNVLGVYSTNGGFPGAIGFDGSNVWVTNSGTQSLSKNRVGDGQLVGGFPMGFGGAGVAFDGLNMWVANEDVVLKYRANDGALLGSFPGSFNGSGRYETAVTFDGTYVWVANYVANTVTRYRDYGQSDLSAPVTTTTNSPTANPAGWNNSNVSVSLSAADESGGSGVASLTYSATGAQSIAQTTVSGASTNVNITAEGQTTISYFAIDNAGNTEQVKTLVVKIDKTAPVITVTSPSSGNYLLNQAVTVQFSCTDAGSGVAACNGTSASGATLDTSSAGAKTFTVTAADNAGNSATPIVVNYTVGYNVVVLSDQSKAAKSGSTIPIKIRLVDATGANMSSPSTVVHAVSVQQISSQSSSTLDDAGNANPDFDFRYDASLQGYIFNLKTTGYVTGTYLLNFVVDVSPPTHSVGFQVRQ